MNNNGLFSVANKLKSYNIYVDELDLIPEAIISLDLLYNNDTPEITGILVLNDIYNLNEGVYWPDVIVRIEYMDIFDSLTSKLFKVINLNEFKHGLQKKGLVLVLQDTFSYKLDHSFLSKGYNDTPANAVSEYISKLELGTDYELDFSKIDDKRQFIVPKSISNLNFFSKEFFKYGYNFYQTRSKVYLKSQEDLKIANMFEHEDIFTDETDNQFYKNRIIEMRVKGSNRAELQPKTRSFAFDHSKKSMVFYDNNDNSSYTLNDDKTNLQDTQGYRDTYQQHLNFSEHDRKLRESLLKQGQIEIIVNGYAKNDVNQIYNLEIKGNISTTDGFAKGNMIMSGKYISTRIVDKIIGNSFIQKIFLERADAQKKV